MRGTAREHGPLPGRLVEGALVSVAVRLRLACGASGSGRISLGAAYHQGVRLLMLTDAMASPAGGESTVGGLDR